MKVWLVLPDPFSSRLFFDTGIVDGLRGRLGDELELFLLDLGEDAPAWAERAGSSPVTRPEDLGATVSLPEKALRRGDASLDRLFGFYPLSLRHSLQHGFNRERMRAGHQNWFLDPTLAGPVPRTWPLDRAMLSWHYGRLRYIPRTLSRRLRAERPAVVLGNIQMHAVVPYVVGARRLGLPVVGHVASWDHTVGKGIVAPDLRRYIVQNDVMRDDLVQYHGIEAARVVVTGWPQTDVFYRKRPRAEYESLLSELGLDPSRRVVLAMGNTPTNAPYEARFVERLVAWWRDSRAGFSLLFRPHPRDRDWRARFAAAIAADGVGVQEPSFTDLETLAVLLQHGDCVVANAGTILLDAVVSDRPAVCVLYDEGAPAGESFALKNVSGEHYKALMESDAFYRADRFDDVITGIERGLEHPEELRAERARIAGEVVGKVDGRAGERVVMAVLGAVQPSATPLE